jgi:hypothetical protein
LLISLSALLLPAAAQNPSPGSAVWLADHKHLKRIDLVTIQVDLIVSYDHEAEALAVDPAEGTVWALIEKQLTKFDRGGQTILQVDLKDQTKKLDEPRSLVFNPYDATLWVAGEKVLLHLDAQGEPLQEWGASDEIQSMGLDVDESLWLLTHRQLLHLSPQGAVLQGLDLKSYIKEPEHLAVDSLGGLLWVAGKKELIQLELNQLNQAPRLVSVPGMEPGKEKDDDNDNKKILALAVDPLMGNLWAITKQHYLLIYDRGGSLLKTVDLGPHDLGEVETLAFEPVSTSLWLGGKKAVVRLTSNGDLVARIATDKEAEALGVSPFRLLPTLSLMEPLDGSLTNNTRPSIRLGLGANCNAVPCLMPGAYHQSLLLDVMLNGLAIGNLFTIAQGEAHYTPSQRLPEGTNSFTAQAKDLFGHSSEKITSQFKVDTIPPKFLSINPTDGSTLTTATVMIQGTLDDSTANTTLLDAAGTVVSMASGANFSFAVNLSPGINVFSLIARDPAGNETSIMLHLTYVAVTVTLANPLPGASLTSTAIDVNGSFQGPPNTGITVNGVVAMIYGDQFYANLDLEPGVNTLTITATTPNGATVTKTITVTVTASAPDPVQVAVSPQSGVAPLPVQFTVTNNSSLGMTKVEADFDGNGTMDFTAADATAPIAYIYTNPGAYRASIRVTDSQGAVHRKVLFVVVNDPAQMDQFFTSLWNGMNNALKVGNVNGAARYLNESAKRKYQPVFESLKSQFPQIIASYSPLRRISITDNIGEYAIVRNVNNQNHVYLVYFLQDADGVWRVDAM